MEIERFSTISEDKWSFKPSENKWSKKEILGHLCDSALNNIRRFVITQYKIENIVYDQNFWVKAQNYQSTETQDIINLWKILNLHIINVVENIPDSSLEKICDMTKNETEFFSLKFIIDDYIQHMNHHLSKI